MTRRNVVISAILGVLYAVGAAGHLWEGTRAAFIGTTALFLPLSALMVVAAAWHEHPRPRLGSWLLGASVVTWAVEVLGVLTGAVFGTYHYGNALGWTLLGVPPVIGLNWAMVVWGLYELSRRVLPQISLPLRTLVVAAGAVVFDSLLEPAAVTLGYWTWASSAVPLQNFVSWAILAGTLSVSLDRWVGAESRYPLPAVLVGLQASFFLTWDLWGTQS